MNRRTVLVFLVLALLAAVLAASNLNQQPVSQVPVSEPAATEFIPAATAVPDEPVRVLPTVAYSEPEEVPTAAVPEVLEYSSALDLMWNTCRKFSGGPQYEWQLDYLQDLLPTVGLDLYTYPPSSWWIGLPWYGILSTYQEWRVATSDPYSEYCFYVLTADDWTNSELLQYVAPMGRGQLVYENQDGEFVVLKVYYNVSDRDMK